jgi:hypothetical protein
MTNQTPPPPQNPPPSERGFLDRRIWRLSFLITGNELAAAELVDRVQHAHDVRGMEPARLDRLIIQQAREMLGTATGASRTAGRTPPRSPLMEHAPPAARRAFAIVQSLAEQPREAWVLSRIDQVDDLHVSRAMDCSKTAAMNHLGAADAHVRAALAPPADGAPSGATPADSAAPPAPLDYDRAVEALRAFADTLDPGRIIAQARARRQQQRIRRAGIIAIIIFVLVLLATLVWLKGWLAIP